MTTAGKTSNETAVMQALWRLAHRKGRHEVVLPSLSECRRIRFALYNAVRKVRIGAERDAELEAAVAECSVSIEGTTLVLQARAATPAMAAVLNSLGAEGEGLLELTPKAQEEVEIAESEARLLKKLAEEGDALRVTPYYTR